MRLLAVPLVLALVPYTMVQGKKGGKCPYDIIIGEPLK